MAMHEETCWFHIELLTDVLTDLDQVTTAGLALAGLRFVAMLDARQFGWQWLTTGLVARRGLSLALQFFQFSFQCRQVASQSLAKQLKLLPAVCFAGLAKFDALHVRQFQRQRLDLHVFGFSRREHFILLNLQGLQLNILLSKPRASFGELPALLRNLLIFLSQHCLKLRKQRRVGIVTG
ncbi:hypothetical protein ASD07_29710 [Duganella sp. Root336D2]|nr:hypothetical protein ASD07_29710 [Duganella sp. Root336D2]